MSLEARFTLVDLVRERGWAEEGRREDALWDALMVCNECDHRLIEHDQVAFTCRICSCDQSQRGLSAHADEYLTDFDEALRAARSDQEERL